MVNELIKRGEDVRVLVRDKQKIIEFVKHQLNCESPKTRKKAREFLKKWG